MNKSYKIFNDSPNIIGLNSFKKSLEKHFFAKVNLLVDTSKKNINSHLAIDIVCTNLRLIDGLYHLNSGNWGGFHKNTAQLKYSDFQLAVHNLQKNNVQEIIVEEITIHFKETSIYITKIPHVDIANQLFMILNTVSENFVHYTKGLKEMPYEIFIPVFEDEKNSSRKNLCTPKEITSYLNYWGLYFKNEENNDSFIYDVRNKDIIDSELLFIR